MTQRTDIDPAELRCSWIRFESRHVSGLDERYVGTLRVEWKSPTGRFTLLKAMKANPMGYLDEMLPFIAEDVLNAYQQATAPTNR